MPLRRVLLTLIVLMLAMSAAGSISNRETTPTRSIPPAPPPQGETLRSVTGTLPDDRVVRARVGDRVELRVEAPYPDTVELTGYDLIEAVDETTPALFDFIADRAGRFAVRLQASERTVGAVEVSERP
jgi:hypothetical protein